MPVCFGRFELDPASRTLRCDGEALQLQPVVFDLLVYLVRAEGRVVSKDELLAQVWAGVHVSEGSLQRAVSLLRVALRSGDLADAVQTHARRGYRFGEPVRAVPPTRPASEPPRARTEESEAQWEARADEALCRGALADAVLPLECALAESDARGDHEAAARAALRLTNVKLELNELSIAKAWHARALALLAQLSECPQHAMAAWLSARIALFDGALEACGAHALDAIAIARRVGDRDVETLGLVYRGHVLIASGEVHQGLALHDEAGVAALAGRLGMWTSGVVFCSVVLAYLNLGDTHRAGQWTQEFTRWCERHPAYAYPALCRLHVGEVLAQRGDLASAEHQVSRARQELARSGPYTEGDAWRVLGNIHLWRGELDAAESAFREAHRLGWSPQPGLAQVFAARGQVDAAIKQLERTLEAPGWADGQRARRLLSALACIAARGGQLARARSALTTLAGLDDAGATPASCAEHDRAAAELSAAEREWTRAESLLRSAIASWLTAGARLEAAHGRLRLAEWLCKAGDGSAAELELSAAEATFREVDAAALLGVCAELRATLG